MNIKHVFFDLDHTLWDFETNSNQTFEFILKKNKISINYSDFKEKYRPINQKYWKLYREEKVSKEALRTGRLTETFHELNFEATPELVSVLSYEYIEHLASYNALFEGAIEVLEYLYAKYELHIITNGFEEVQYRKMESSFISKYFKHIITSERVGVKKPNPAIFNFAMQLSGAKSSESIMIGDNFEADILGAKSVGMQTVFCDFNGEIATEEVITISKLKQLKDIL
jgi:putative hydrolase of the HAD superfamily